MESEGLAFNRVHPNYFLVGGYECVQQYDMRKFDKPIFEYSTTFPFPKGGDTVCSDLKYLSDGSQFVACFQNYYPTLYTTNVSNPTHTFYGLEYANISSVKSIDVAKFGNSSFVIAGSDNKKVYTWQIPSNSSLSKESGADNPCLNGSSFERNIRGSVRMFQMPHQIISSCHLGNVNNVLYNLENNCLYASGVEKDIVLHAPNHISFYEEKGEPDPVTKEDEEFLNYYETINSAYAPTTSYLLQLPIERAGLVLQIK